MSGPIFTTMPVSQRNDLGDETFARLSSSNDLDRITCCRYVDTDW